MNKYEMLHNFLKKKIGHDCSRLILEYIYDYDSKKPIETKLIYNQIQFTNRNEKVYYFLEYYIYNNNFATPFATPNLIDYYDSIALFNHSDFVWNKEDYIFTRGIDTNFLLHKYENIKYIPFKKNSQCNYHDGIILPTDIYFKDNHYYFINEKINI